MAEFNNFDLEIEDLKDAVVEHKNGSVTTAGTPVTITATGSKKILSALIINQAVGPQANSLGDLLYVSFDGGSNYTTISRRGNIAIQGAYDDIRVDSNNNGVKYEIILVRKT